MNLTARLLVAFLAPVTVVVGVLLILSWGGEALLSALYIGGYLMVMTALLTVFLWRPVMARVEAEGFGFLTRLAGVGASTFALVFVAGVVESVLRGTFFMSLFVGGPMVGVGVVGCCLDAALRPVWPVGRPRSRGSV